MRCVGREEGVDELVLRRNVQRRWFGGVRRLATKRLHGLWRSGNRNRRCRAKRRDQARDQLAGVGPDGCEKAFFKIRGGLRFRVLWEVEIKRFMHSRWGCLDGRPELVVGGDPVDCFRYRGQRRGIERGKHADSFLDWWLRVWCGRRNGRHRHDRCRCPK